MAEQTAVVSHVNQGVESWEHQYNMCKVLVKSGFLPSAVNKPEAALAIVLKGRELGIPPMQSFSHINVVQGKPTCSAELQLALMARGGVTYKFTEDTDEVATIVFDRPGFEPYTSTFTMQDATRAGLKGTNWQKYPKAMLRARAISAGARVIGADLIGGMSYTPEELGATVDFETGEVLHTEAEVIEDPPELATQGELDKLVSKGAEMVKDGLLDKDSFEKMRAECLTGMQKGRFTKYIERFGQIIKDGCKATEEEIQVLVEAVDQAESEGVIDSAHSETILSSLADQPSKGWVETQIAEVEKAYEKGETA